MLDLEGLALKKLGEYRLNHTLCVADSAEDLAKKYFVDPDKARTAAMLHDIMKDTAYDDLLRMFDQSGIILTRDDLRSPQIWHGMAAAAYLRDELKIEDEDIFNAVYYHSTGRAGMTELEKVIFVADYISADRKYEDVEEMRRLSKISLDEAIIYALVFQIRRLAGERGYIHPNSLACYNELLDKKNSNGNKNNNLGGMA
ncbi:MAG TPA: bis(5'-nucleosyl)-tetraphosphatase (symmetrical) YqeK [Clostridiales bacterium]|nr:bis(5'-nucleosyl)-tetraphosphatase (symmetrical) YqeK [Clostridiales bacterium]